MEVWHRDLGDVDSWHGGGSSPIIHDGICYLNFGPGTESALVACDVKTGNVVWKTEPPKSGRGFAFPGGFPAFGPPRGGPRRRGPPGSPNDPSDKSTAFEDASRTGDFSGKGGFNGSWSTPVVLRVDNREELVVVESSQVAAYDLKTGAELWHCGGLPPQVFATPAVGDGVLVAMGHAIPKRTQFRMRRLVRHWPSPAAKSFCGPTMPCGALVLVTDAHRHNGKNLMPSRIGGVFERDPAPGNRPVCVRSFVPGRLDGPTDILSPAPQCLGGMTVTPISLPRKSTRSREVVACVPATSKRYSSQ